MQLQIHYRNYRILFRNTKEAEKVEFSEADSDTGASSASLFIRKPAEKTETAERPVAAASAKSEDDGKHYY